VGFSGRGKVENSDIANCDIEGVNTEQILALNEHAKLTPERFVVEQLAKN